MTSERGHALDQNATGYYSPVPDSARRATGTYQSQADSNREKEMIPNAPNAGCIIRSSSKKVTTQGSRKSAINRRDRNPMHVVNIGSCSQKKKKEKKKEGRTISSSDSSFGSSFFSSSFGASAAAAPPEAAAAPPTAGAPPPPTFERRSFTFLPSSAFARSDAQMGSSSTPAPSVRARILSDYLCAKVQGKHK
jgi:hypothetical protein